MRSADRWQQYQLLDASGGERLERWGDIVLVRPDPAVLWNTPKTHPLWKEPHGVYHRSSKGGGSWEYRKPVPQSWQIAYDDLTFKISLTDFKHTGLFPEQAVNWDWYQKRIAAAGRPIKVLNLFAYTGGATLACLAAGAQVTHLDASRGMVSWAKDNAALSGLTEKPVRWMVDDAQKFVAREIRRGNLYDGVIMDPPSYGRGPSGEVWKLEDGIYDLLALTAGALTANPLFFSVNSYTAGISPGVMAYMVDKLLVPRFGGGVQAEEIGLPVQSTEGTLPCGSTALWTDRP